MKYTPNYNLKKPELTDTVKIDDLNSNMDAIDGELNKKSDIGHKHTKSEITDFPISLPANGGIADKLNIVDTRSINSPPSYYFGLGKNMFWEFKHRTSVGSPPTNASASGTYAFILTITGWGDSSGGYPVQISVGGQNIAIRQGISTYDWGSWYVIPNMSDIPTKLSELEIDVDKTIVDTGDNADYTGVEYKITVKNGKPYLEVIST